MRFNKLPKSLVASFLGNIARKENIVISTERFGVYTIDTDLTYAE
jgi:hypothetical protein